MSFLMLTIVSSIVLLKTASSRGDTFSPEPSVRLTSNKEFIAVGDTLVLNCTVLRGSFSELRIVFNQRDVPVQNAGPATVQSIISHVSLDQSGNYKCYKDGAAKAFHSIHVGYPPDKPRNIRCESPDLVSLKCSWDPGRAEAQSNFATTWSLTYRLDPTKGDFIACPLFKPNSTCLWNAHDDRGNQASFKPAFTYYLLVNARNELGSVSSGVIPINTKNIVKPSPVRIEESLSMPNVTSTTAELFLKTKIAVGRPFFPFIYNITYYINDCNQVPDCDGEQMIWKSGHLHVCPKPGEHRVFAKSACVVIEGLTPFTRYNFSVSIKPNESGYWSSPTTVSLTTLQDVPVVSPRCDGSSFTDYPLNETHRMINLYWQTPDRRGSHGIITQYRIILRAVHGSAKRPGYDGELIKQVVNTSENDRVLSMSASLYSEREYVVEIAAATALGYGPNNTAVHIPAQSRVLHPVSMVTAEVNESHVIMSWERPTDHDITTEVSGFTLHYCKGERSQPDKVVANCREHYKWEKVGPNTTMGILAIVEEEQKDYAFGVSWESDSLTSGIKWARCTFKQNTAPGKVNDVVAETMSTFEVSVNWEEMTCATPVGKVLYHQIAYCNSQVHIGCKCSKGTIVDIHGEWDRRGALIGELRPASDYTICVRGVTRHQQYGLWSDPILALTLTPTPTALIVGCMAAGIFFLFLGIIIIWACYRLRRPFDGDPIVIPPKPDYAEDNTYKYEDVGPSDDKPEDLRDQQYQYPGEREPLMTCVPPVTFGPGVHQQSSVSRDSGNDSYSDDSSPTNNQFMREDIVEHKIDKLHENGVGGTSHPQDATTMEMSELGETAEQEKRESSFFESSTAGAETSWKASYENLNCKGPSVPFTEIIVNSVEAGKPMDVRRKGETQLSSENTRDESASTISSYAKFEDVTCPDSHLSQLPSCERQNSKSKPSVNKPFVNKSSPGCHGRKVLERDYAVYDQIDDESIGQVNPDVDDYSTNNSNSGGEGSGSVMLDELIFVEGATSDGYVQQMDVFNSSPIKQESLPVRPLTSAVSPVSKTGFVPYVPATSDRNVVPEPPSKATLTAGLTVGELPDDHSSSYVAHNAISFSVNDSQVSPAKTAVGGAQ